MIFWGKTIAISHDFSLIYCLKGTSSLGLRIGIHSGPTTAGVLRGEKARFQLFGDVRFCYALLYSNMMSLVVNQK